MTPEKLDIIFLLIIVVPAVVGLIRGFVKTALGFLPIPIAIIGTYFIAPPVCSWARGTRFYEILYEKISTSFKFEGVLNVYGAANATEYVNNMRIPQFLKTALLNNDNSVVKGILGTTDVHSYISGFLANICMNVIVVIIIFVVILIICYIILALLDMLSNLPVLSFFSRFFGMIVGAIQGLAIIWILGIILTYFTVNPNSGLMTLISQTQLASFLFENNLLLFLIINVFT
ncbi:MAG: CvpA family protein [Firmicutes bacterium]|nr:CvpA family protein [Bacillota bacterium]